MTAVEDEIKFFRIRLPAPMHAKIVARARKNRRSVNAEIVRLLEERLQDEP